MTLAEARLAALKTQIEDVVFEAVSDAQSDPDRGPGSFSYPAADKIIDAIRELMPD